MPQDFDNPEQHAQQFLHVVRDVPFFFPVFFIKTKTLTTPARPYKKVYHINPAPSPQGIKPRGKDLYSPFIPAARPQGILEGAG